jgi:hypothetical protein
VWLAAIWLFLSITRRSLAEALLPPLVAQIFLYYLAVSVSSLDPMYAIDGLPANRSLPGADRGAGARIPARRLV